MGRERDYRAEYQRRVERAKSQGFGSYRQQRQRPSRQPAASVEAQRRALDAVGFMRRDGLSLSTAARKASTTPATVRRHAGLALDTTARRVKVKPSDRIRRPMSVLTPAGVVDVVLRDFDEASLVGQHWAAVRRFLATGDHSALAKFSAVTVAGVEFETGLDAIERWGRIGEIDLDDIYSITTK